MASENSGGPHLPPSWPEAPRADVPTSWPELPPQEPPAWPEPTPLQDPLPAWGSSPATDQTPAWNPSPTTDQNPAWNPSPAPDQDPPWNPTPTTGQSPAWNPAPAADQNPAAWSNLATPAPWPPQGNQVSGPTTWQAQPSGDPLDTSTPWPAQPQAPMPQGDPMERTITYGAAYPTPAADPLSGGPMPGGPLPGGPGPYGELSGGPNNAGPYGGPLGAGAAAGGALLDGGQHMGAMPTEARPGSNLSRDPSDPDRPFVTAGQISGSRTPPPERQQELWNTVFGDQYDAMGDQMPDEDEPSKPVWIYALAGSVAIALVVALVWAFWAGPLASAEDPKSSTLAPVGKTTTKAPTTTPPTKSSIPRLPKFPGTASPVLGTVADPSAGISIPRLGGKWLLDQRGTLIKSTYGFTTRQFVKTGTDATGNPISAHVMTGPLNPAFAKYYTSPDNLEPVIKAVVVNARKKLFPEGNTVKKTAQQALKADGLPARLIAYEVTAGEATTTVVVAAISAGGDVPAIVYMSVPGTSKTLMPDINNVFKQIKITQG